MSTICPDCGQGIGSVDSTVAPMSRRHCARCGPWSNCTPQPITDFRAIWQVQTDEEIMESARRNLGKGAVFFLKACEKSMASVKIEEDDE